jgi:hypothetical protein
VSKAFIVVYEAPADFTTATEIADRVLINEISWLDEGLLDSQRLWVAKDDSGNPLSWKSIGKLAKKQGIVVRGHFDGKPGLPDAAAARRAIQLILRCFSSVDAILLIRDADDQPERRQGLEQARSASSAVAPQPAIVIGVAVVERESWVISGFNPENANERQSLEGERQKLGFNPCDYSHQLTACKDDQAKKSPKRVLAIITNSDCERQRRCWLETNLSLLETRGKSNGLAAFLDEIKHTLVPLLNSRHL